MNATRKHAWASHVLAACLAGSALCAVASDRRDEEPLPPDMGCIKKVPPNVTGHVRVFDPALGQDVDLEFNRYGYENLGCLPPGTYALTFGVSAEFLVGRRTNKVHGTMKTTLQVETGHRYSFSAGLDTLTKQLRFGHTDTDLSVRPDGSVFRVREANPPPFHLDGTSPVEIHY